MKLLTLPEILKEVRVSSSTLSNYRKAGLFPEPLYGKGKKLVWEESQIEKWLAEKSAPPVNTVPSATPAASKTNQAKSLEDRLKHAKNRLALHAVGRKPNRKTK